jgi:hypothetical protein
VVTAPIDGIDAHWAMYFESRQFDVHAANGDVAQSWSAIWGTAVVVCQLLWP